MNKQITILNWFKSKNILQLLFSVIILANSNNIVFSQETKNKNCQILTKVFITQSYNYSYKSHEYKHYYAQELRANNNPFGDLRLGLNYNLHFPNHIELLSNISYIYEKDYATYEDHFMDEWGTSEVHVKNHLISLDLGIKVFIPRKWNRLYFRISTSVTYSIYRRNDFYVPGQYHYQEFKSPTFSSMNLLTGFGFDIPIFSNQFINLEIGHIIPANGYANVVYSYKLYAQIGYGFTF